MSPAPVRLRAVAGNCIGTTAFFRNRALLGTLMGEIARLGRARVDVLVHACSIGAEAYSIALAALLDPRTRHIEVNCWATDIAHEFVRVTHEGRYPQTILAGMGPEERACFDADPAAPGTVMVGQKLRARVRMLPPCSFVTARFARPFDVVAITNALLYVPAEQQAATLRAVAGYNSGLLVATGFHQDQVKQDMVDGGYEPVTDNAEAIHNGWLDRRLDITGEQRIPGRIYHPWSLPAFARIPDHEYKFGAIFRKRPIESAAAA